MKICKLKLKNLNSFREAIEIDFEKSPLDDASLVAITGPTGSGKTTLLDAICVALYGKTPRLSGTGSQNPNHLISHGEKEGFAEVLFMANGTRYLATWSVKRNSTPNVQLFYADDGKLISDKLSTRGKSLGSSQNTVSEEVESILGLDFDAFRRSVLLAQGEFAAFLKASNEERRTILEATAGISIYDVLKQALNDKVSEVEIANAEVYDKLNKIPEASREQLAEAETELNSLQTETAALGTESRHIQQAKERETKRKEDYEKHQSSEKRHRELSDQQPEIDALESERALAEKAQRLLPEKQAFDTAASELESADEDFRVATAEKTEATEQIESDQTDFDAKAAAFEEASDKYAQQTQVYAEAKLDVERAKERFEAADKRNPDLVDLDEQINTLKGKLAERRTEQTQLQERIGEAQAFLDNNHLPANSPQRLNDATGLLAELATHQKQLERTSVSKAEGEKRVSSLKQDIKKLSDTQAKRFSEKAAAETTLEDASDALNALLTTGTLDEWTTQRQQAVKAQPIAQRYETAKDNLVDAEDNLHALNEAKAGLDTELEEIEGKLVSQEAVYQRAAEVVQHREEQRESAKWAIPINQLRQQLHTGEPCPVCGATEHPSADVVESEGEERLQNAETALEGAKAEAQVAQDQMRTLETRQVQTEQSQHNTTDQIKEGTAEVKELRDKTEQFLVEWQETFPDVDISTDWTSRRIEEADAAIGNLREAEHAHTQAESDCKMATQQLEICENNIANEKKSLRQTEKQLEDVHNDVEDLEADITSVETRFWELLPDAFHGVTPKEAKDLFEDKIKAVEAREDERDTAKAQLQVLDANIRADQSTLKDLKKRHKALQAEIDGYKQEGGAFLNTVREKTDGLETEDAINAAIDRLETALQAKENERDTADQRLQKSRESLTQKQTAHKIAEDRRAQCGEKFDNAYSAYTDKLRDAGFDSFAAHSEAFRDEAQLQELTAQIDAYKSEIQQLALEITELKTRFEETPYDPEALEQIESQLEEIEARLESKREKIGAQGEIIKGIKDALEKREALGDELGAAQQELERWQRLHETIPANTLRDFALEIMFRQMGNLANEQLKYLTSERYQLKVETIGDLSVIDRWNANEERPVETLSGGESFLTSLALALALSELSRGRAQLNSLFLDEGFGTLDAETLDIAIAALEGLRMQGRNIFLISHIQELTRRLPVKINVRKRGDDGTYSSSIDIRG